MIDRLPELSEHQLTIFDDVILSLALEVEIETRAELAEKLAELARARSPEYRCEQIVALEIDFLARHRVVAGAAHGFCVVAQFATVLQRDFDDALIGIHLHPIAAKDQVEWITIKTRHRRRVGHHRTQR